MGIEIPKIEVRYEHMAVEGDVYVGSRALPTLLNVTLNTIEVFFIFYFPFFFYNDLRIQFWFPLKNFVRNLFSNDYLFK